MLKKKGIIFCAAAIMALTTGCTANGNQENENTASSSQQEVQYEIAEFDMAKAIENQLSPLAEGDVSAVIKTNMGDITVKLFPDKAPKAVENFITHAKEGYYDGLIFHRVIDDFMIQGGDPLGNGTGGESIWGEPFEDEFTPELHNFRGALSMANAGANTNGSQFFIVQADEVSQEMIDSVEAIKKDPQYSESIVDLTDDNKGITINQVYSDEVIEKYKEIGGTIHLDYAHTVFGQVVEGMDVVDAIAAVDTDENDKPIEDVVIESIEVNE